MQPDAGAALSRRLSLHGGPAVRLSASQTAICGRLRALLDDGTLRLASGGCPCGAQPRDEPVGELDRYGIALRSVVCMECGTLRFDPYLDEESLQRFYSEYYQELYERSPDAETYFASQQAYGARVLQALRRHAPQARSVVEAGCGAGGAMSVLHEAGLQVAGCDHSARLVRFGQSKGMHSLVVGGIEHLQQRVEAVYLHHVFEHLGDPVGFLRRCKELVGTSGLVLLIVPDIARIDRFAFPGGDVRLFLHVAHKFNYSRRGLAMLAARAGYAIEPIGGFESRKAPEMWLALRPASGAAVQQGAEGEGQAMLRYLRRTEKLYRLGVLPGYGVGLLGRLGRLTATLAGTPAR